MSIRSTVRAGLLTLHRMGVTAAGKRLIYFAGKPFSSEVIDIDPDYARKTLENYSPPPAIVAALPKISLLSRTIMTFR